MTSINRPFSNTVGATNGVSTAGTGGAIPAHLAGLVAVNPKLAEYYKADAGLRALLDHNKANLVEFGNQPPAGKVADKVTWETWCHATSIVPAHVRDEEYVVIVARGTAYKNPNDIQIPLQNGKNATSDGRIVYVGKTKDLLGTQKKADENGHYPGAITVDVSIPVAGAAGEKVSLAYARISPNAAGQSHPSHSGWPDSFEGVW
ncbi:MAG TPA: hypothetical protein VGF99_17495, partial [Myxococcota bacterium]